MKLKKIMFWSGLITLILVLAISGFYFNFQQSIVGEKTQVYKATYTSLQCGTCEAGAFNNNNQPKIFKATGTGILDKFSLSTNTFDMECNEKAVDGKSGDFLDGCNFKVITDSGTPLKFQKCNKENICSDSVSYTMTCDYPSGFNTKLSASCSTQKLNPIHIDRGGKLIFYPRVFVNTEIEVNNQQYCLKISNPVGDNLELAGCNTDLLQSESDYKDLAVSSKDKSNIPLSGALGINFQIQKAFYGYLQFGSPADLIKNPETGKVVFMIKKPQALLACSTELDSNGIYIVNDNECTENHPFECLPSGTNCDPFTGKIVKTVAKASCAGSQSVHQYVNGEYKLCEYSCKDGKFGTPVCNTVEQVGLLEGSPCAQNEGYDAITKKCYAKNVVDESKKCEKEGGSLVKKDTSVCGFSCNIGLSEPTKSTETFCQKPNYLGYILLGAFGLIALMLLFGGSKQQPQQIIRRKY